MSENSKRRNNKSYGWVRRKVSEGRKGHKHSKETLEKISRNRKGIKHTTKTKELIAKAVQERVKEGNHNFQLQNKVPPWENAAATKASIEVWENADKIYLYWLKNPAGGRSLNTKLNFNSKKACLSMESKFKKGWNPKLDNTWLQFKGIA